MKIEHTTSSMIADLWHEMEQRIHQSKNLEEAAQELATALHTEFVESVVLSRVYIAVPFDALPAPNKTFVQNLVDSAGSASELKPTTPVLSLVGTHGESPDWNDRRKSKGHVAARKNKRPPRSVASGR
jgi:hypothetical protein